MNTVRFTTYHNYGYKCDKPGEHSGEYVRAEDVIALERRNNDLLAALQAVSDYFGPEEETSEHRYPVAGIVRRALTVANKQ